MKWRYEQEISRRCFCKESQMEADSNGSKSLYSSFGIPPIQKKKKTFCATEAEVFAKR